MALKRKRPVLFEIKNATIPIVASRRPFIVAAMTEPDVLCTCSHRARFHEGRKLLCVMASCMQCEGFKPKPAPAAEPTAEETYQAQLEQMRANDAAALKV